jgi:proliferating cell nuclear antigen
MACFGLYAETDVYGQFEQISSFQKIIKSILLVVDEVQFSFGENGISMQAMDLAHVCIVEMLLTTSFFNEYVCPLALCCTVGLKLSQLKTLLEMLDSLDTVEIRTSGSSDTLDIKAMSQSRDTIKDLGVKLLEMSGDRIDIPEQAPDCELIMPSSLFSKIVKDMLKMGDIVVLDIYDDTALFVTTNQDAGSAYKSATVQFQASVFSKFSFSTQVHCEFAAKYLEKFSHAHDVASTVTIRLYNDRPGSFSFYTGGSPSATAHLTFYLAPRISDEGSAEPTTVVDSDMDD